MLKDSEVFSHMADSQIKLQSLSAGFKIHEKPEPSRSP